MGDTSFQSRNARKHANRKARRDEKRRLEEATKSVEMPFDLHVECTPGLPFQLCFEIPIGAPRIESWMLSVDESGRRIITGSVCNGAGYKDGSPVQTSPLVTCSYNFAVTTSGAKYFLGAPSDDYIEYRKAHGLGSMKHKALYF